MKLKKIASLMLAGIMAVSMLAGCKSGDKNSTDSETPEVTPVTGAAAVINAELDEKKDQISFVNDEKLGSLLSQYCTANFTKPTDLDKYQNITDRATAYESTIGNWATNLYGADGCGFTSVIKDSNTSAKTGLEVYVMSGDLLTEENALRLIGQYIDGTGVTLPKESSDTNKSYSYTGTVAAVNAETKGKTENVWVIGITITQTPADK